VVSPRLLLGLLVGALLAWAPAAVPAAEAPSPAAAAALERYRLQRLSTAAYDGEPRVPVLPWGPSEPEPPRPRPRLDVHATVAGHAARACTDCHADQARDVHATRGNTVCQQCHGGHPIASIDHYFAPLNPLRRHAYVCAKCHEGASASFASFVVHASAASPALRERFPALYWADRFMFALIAGVMALFVVHALSWWLREWFVRRRRSPS